MTSAPRDGLGAVIFDLDGTVTDTWPVAIAAFRAAFAEFAPGPFTDKELMALAGPSEDGIMRRLLPDRWRACFERYLEEYAARHGDDPLLFRGIGDVLDLLRSRGVPLAIVTGKARRAAEITLEHAGIAGYFECVEAGSAGGNVKPQAIRRLGRRWSIDGHRVAYVGDTDKDIRAARAAGVVAIGAAWSGTARAPLLEGAGADVVFTEVERFRAWLDGKTA